MNRQKVEQAILNKLRDGKPQDVIDLWNTLKANKKLSEVVFAIVLDGLEQAGFIERVSLNAGIFVKLASSLN